MQTGKPAVQKGAGVCDRADPPQSQDSRKERPAARLSQLRRVFRTGIWYFPILQLHTIPLVFFSYYNIIPKLMFDCKCGGELNCYLL